MHLLTNTHGLKSLRIALCLIMITSAAPDRWCYADTSLALMANSVETHIYRERRIDKTTESMIREVLQQLDIHNLQEYLSWYQANIKYINDPNGDAMFNPVETLKQGGGDCEDLAFLNEAVLKILGYEPVILAQGRGKFAHAFCVFKMGGTYNVIDNVGFVQTTLSSLNQITDYLIKKHKSEYVLELYNNPKQFRVLYTEKPQTPPARHASLLI